MASSKGKRSLHLLEAVRRAFVQFLTIPTIVVVFFLLLSTLVYFLDRWRIDYGWPAPIPITHEAAIRLLGTVATSIITVTSITFSLLLVAVQQGAAALTAQVYDQFLRRRANQFFFGFFIGLALYCLVVLVTIHRAYTPVYGVTLALVLTAIALYLLILLIYSTIDQMRPVMIVRAIRDHTLHARQGQAELLRHTRSRPRSDQSSAAAVGSDAGGFLTDVNVSELKKAVSEVTPDAEIVVSRSIGEYIAFGDPIAEIRSARAPDLSKIESRIRAALPIEMQRDLSSDAAFGIEQLTIIGWTSISTAKSNPQPGLLACWSLRDILSRWSGGENVVRNEDVANEAASPVVYVDNVPAVLMSAFESLAVVASESMQHQSIAEIYLAIAGSFQRLTPALQDRAEDIVLRSISALGEHVPTRGLGAALAAVATVLEEAHRREAAHAVRTAAKQLEANVGQLNSRGTRASAAA